VLVGSKLKQASPPSRARYAIPLGLAALAGSAAFIALTTKNADQPASNAATSPVSSGDQVRSVVSNAAPTMTAAEATPPSPPPTEVEVAPAPSATAAPTVKVASSTGGNKPRPVATPSAVATAPAAVPTSTARGVAGDLTIQPH
jgi:hypothetical protein